MWAGLRSSEQRVKSTPAKRKTRPGSQRVQLDHVLPRGAAEQLAVLVRPAVAPLPAALECDQAHAVVLDDLGALFPGCAGRVEKVQVTPALVDAQDACVAAVGGEDVAVAQH